jgi:hypothetical protein
LELVWVRVACFPLSNLLRVNRTGRQPAQLAWEAGQDHLDAFGLGGWLD